ncbi:hypothetical protein [Actinoplanes sp. CA-252034]|uniref:hypothetical protein n=1 Tax=Actinoplanes sp. CA-252034 TaxID=3239906 RepID=UPI003D97F80F
MTRLRGKREERENHDGSTSWQWLLVVLAVATVGGIGYWSEGVFAGVTAAVATAGVAQQFLK